MLTSASAITKTELRSAIVRNPLIVAPDTTVRDAITQMSALHTQCSTSTRDNHPLDELHLEARSSCVLIAENQKLLGILTERDVVRLSTEKRSLESLPVREVMAHPVVTLYESAFTDLFFVINLLKQHRIRHLPILNDQDQIVGLLTHETLRQTSRPTDLLRLRLVAEVMIANVVSVSPDSPILQIAELMAKHRVSSVVIVQEQDSLLIPIGFVTERDLVQCQALNLDLETCMADQVMNISVFPVRKDDSLWVVQQIMEQHLIRHLVVTGEEGELLGIITQTSILQALNPLELYKLAEVLEQKVSQLEAEKIELLTHRNLELERQVEERTAILKAKAKQEELITNLATQIRSSLNLSEILKTTVEQIRSHLNCDRTVIWQLQTDTHVIVAAEASSSQDFYDLGTQTTDPCFSDWIDVYTHGRVRVVPDIYTTPMTDCHRQILENLQIRAKIIVPILLGQTLWGLLVASESNRPRQWLPEEITLLQQLASQVAIAIQQATAYQQIETELAEKRKIEAALIESQNSYITLAAAVPVGIFRTDTEGNCIYVNTSWCSMTGLTPSEAIGGGWTQAIHPQDRDKIVSEWYFVVHENRLSLSINALKDINQQIIGFLAIAKDISQRKEVELERQKLLQELSAFKQGLDQSAIVSITDTKGVIIYVNDRFCEISGYSRDELIGKTHRLINSGYHPSDFFKQLWRTIIQGKVWRGEICNRTRKGDLYWVDSTIVPFLDSQGKPFQYLGIRFDISDRKKIEAELAKSEAQFRGLVEGANDVIWSFDLDGLYTYLSPQFETLFGWKPSEWIGKSFVDLVHPDDLEILIKNNHQYILGGETAHNLEIRHLHRDGHYVWVRISATAIKNEQGTIIGRQGILSDISDRKQYEAQLQQTNLELARATRMKDEFLANMSHELRTPLNAILGMSEAMQEEIFGPLNQKQHQSVQTIEKSGTHLLALINDILDVAKIESGKIELNCTPTPITELCESSLIFIKQQALKKRISIQTEISPYLPNLLIDERRIRQVLINLLNNAIKFTPEGGGVSLTVKLESSTETALSNHYISFAVTDTGIGIAHENLAKLFQPFVQIDSALNRQYMGTGLGLTLVKKIVEMHGGEVKVKSTIDLGSCFAFRLPCQDLLLKSPQSSQETAVNLDPNSTTQVSEKFPIILLAEDHEANIITISRYLKAKGYQIILAENGQEAIDQAKLHRPDLILMDIQMPVMDGLEAIQRIREDSDLTLANIPIIALTALAMTSDKQKCLEAGANDYLTKPVKLSQLTSTIQQILAQGKN